MGNTSSLLLREDEIAQIQDKTGCEYKWLLICLIKQAKVIMPLSYID